ncbi:hypothetical protein ABZ464_03425 [Streptomyces sp. NPDC005820]|uniref:hypothetical protein n=1 Tax=Streptomyces sp. NPDC005820 TaxID=3157069 RepID=UPI003410E315
MGGPTDGSADASADSPADCSAHDGFGRRLALRLVPRGAAALAGYREFGAYVDSDRQTPLAVWAFCAVTGFFWFVLPVVLVARLCLGLGDTRTVWLTPVTLAGPLLLVLGRRVGWWRGVLYRYDRGVVLRRFRSYQAYSWRELTAETHSRWVDEGDGFEHRVRREELELRTRDGTRVHRYDHHPREVSALVRPARKPQRTADP